MSLGCRCKGQPTNTDSSCENFEEAIAYSQQRVVLENEGWDGDLQLPPRKKQGCHEI